MGLLGAFILAVLVALLFSPYKRGDSVMPLIIFFLVLFFAGLAAQFWVIPFGPFLWGVYWFPMVFIVLIFALLLSAPPSHRKPAKNSPADPAVTAMSIFIWILLLVLAVAVIVGFYTADTFIVNPKAR